MTFNHSRDFSNENNLHVAMLISKTKKKSHIYFYIIIKYFILVV